VEIDFPVRVPEKGTQCYELLRAFQRGERLSVKVALDQYGVYALSQRVGELRRMGWPIVDVMTKTSTAHFKTYWM
jgi:hypothetical protein